MHRRTRSSTRLRQALAAAALGACALLAHGQTASPTLTGLAEAFEAAWSRQPEARALPARRDAARAQQQAAAAWTPEAPALEVAGQTDRLTRNRGARELEVGIAVPLWLPGERRSQAALADAEGSALESRLRAARLRLAATVREAWWDGQHARIEADTARDRLDQARRLADDVARRARAGDLARADQHQAEGAVAAAEADLAEAETAVVAARLRLSAMTGQAGVPDSTASARPEPEPVAATADEHATVAELRDRASVAEQAAALAAMQSRANPELTLATTRDRGAFGESYGQTLTLGLRIPFGAGPRHEARRAGAQAEAAEAQAQLALERERVDADRSAAQARVAAARTRLAAAERRATLARESRGFFAKSFRLGETDLPTRLRIEAEAAEAERQAARSRIELSAAISAWRQALGLLPQ